MALNAHDEQGQPIKVGHLPVSEMFSDRSGAGSPFGEELTFPLPVDQVVYRLPDESSIPE